MAPSSRPYDPTLKASYKSDPSLLFLNFNQDASCISIGTRSGFGITNCDPFGRVYVKNDGAVGIVEMLFCTSLVALVGTGDKPTSSTRKLHIVNTKRQSTICELTFPTSILAVRLNRRRLVVVLEEQIYVYDISNMKLAHTIETSPNPQAICALASSSDTSYLAYPSPLPSPTTPFAPAPSSPGQSPNTSGSTPGDVLLFDPISLSVLTVLNAHKAPISTVTFNPSGTRLATSSDKGTVIRVWSCPNGDQVAQFRRGTYNARIYSISFNSTSTLLSVSSDSDTVHIFKLSRSGTQAQFSTTRRWSSGAGGGAGGLTREDSDFGDDDESTHSGAGRFNGDQGQIRGYEAYIDAKRSSSAGIGGTLRKKGLDLGRSLAGAAGGYLPSTLTSMWDPQRDFAFLKLPTSGVRTVVAMSSTTPQVMVLSSEGLFYTYNIDLENGGECILQKSHSLLEGMDDVTSTSASSALDS